MTFQCKTSTAKSQISYCPTCLSSITEQTTSHIIPETYSSLHFFRWWWFIYPVVSDSLRPHRLEPARILCPGNSPGKNTAVSSHSLSQGIFLTQGSNWSFLHCRSILHRRATRGFSGYTLCWRFSYLTGHTFQVLCCLLLICTESTLHVFSE